MLGALPDADWSVEEEILKEKSNIAPANIIAKLARLSGSLLPETSTLATAVCLHLPICVMHPWHQTLPSLTLTLVICPAQTISYVKHIPDETESCYTIRLLWIQVLGLLKVTTIVEDMGQSGSPTK